MRMAERGELVGPPLRDLARLDDAAFRKLFAGTPVKRTGRDRFIRNVLIAIGNSGEPMLAAEAERLIARPLPTGARHGRLGRFAASCRRNASPRSPSAAEAKNTRRGRRGTRCSKRSLAHRESQVGA